jgi:magnesium transporter
MRLHESVAAHVVAAGAHARAQETAAEVLERLRDGNVELVLGVDADGRLVGACGLEKLISNREAKLAALLDPAFPRVKADTDQERAASLALHHGVDALPVVDKDARPIGIMPSQALLQVLRREHVEDLHILSGIRREGSRARHAIEDPPLRRARHRLPWLLVGLAGSGVATAAMASFEATFTAQIAVAFFVPGIVYLADAIGTQSEAIAVRGLSLTHAGISHLLAGEVRTGMLIGAVLALSSFFPIWMVFGDVRLAGAVSTAIFAAGTFAAALGLLLPWWIAKTGRDPAFGSGPVATVIQDVLSLFVYFAVVRLFGI